MDLNLKTIPEKSRGYLEQLFQFYLYDMSEFAKWPLAHDGLFNYDSALLDPYWSRTDHFPYFIVLGDEIVGFSLVRHYPEDTRIIDMGQFFILRKFRGEHLGQSAFEQTVRQHQGRWQVRALIENAPALCFWQASISKLTGNSFTSSVKNYQNATMEFFAFDI